MRMWNVNPKLMCNKHLLGEHVEMHMFIGTLKKNRSLKGYIENKLLEVHNIAKRHDDLVFEMKKRKMHHNSPILESDKSVLYKTGIVDSENNLQELIHRCNNCKEKIKSSL